MLGEQQYISTNAIKHNFGYNFSKEDDEALYSVPFFFTNVVPYFLPIPIGEELKRLFPERIGEAYHLTKKMNLIWDPK